MRPGVELGPLSSTPAAFAGYPGYQTIVFPHEAGVFSVALIRAATDTVLAGLREQAAFDSAMAAIPILAADPDPDRARPLTPVRPGGRLRNTY